MPDTLPEGTDHIVTGNVETSGVRAGGAGTAGSGTAKPASAEIRDEAADLRGRAGAKADELRARAGEKARDYAEQGKVRASGALDEVARMIGDNAGQIDDRLGANYGDYARRAADAVQGFSGQLRDKDVDQLLEDARELVRRSPAIALGAAAAAGFLLARVIKSGSETLQASADTARDAGSGPRA